MLAKTKLVEQVCGFLLLSILFDQPLTFNMPNDIYFVEKEKGKVHRPTQNNHKLHAMHAEF